MVVVLQYVGEVVVEGVGVAEFPSGCLGVEVGRSVRIFRGVSGIVGGDAVETFLILPVVLDATVYLEAEIVYDFPVECRIRGPGVPDLPGVVVRNGEERRGVVAVVGLFVYVLYGGLYRDRGIADGVLETAVAGVGAGVIDGVGACTPDIGPGVAYVQVDAGPLGGLEIALEAEVVTAVPGTGHYGIVAEVGISQGPFCIVAASADGEVHVPVASGVAEYHIHPVIDRKGGIEVYVAEAAEIRLVVGGNVVAHLGELILELDIVLCVHCLDGIPVGHYLETAVGVELHGNLAAFLSALGGYDDNAVCTAATVYCSGECILKHVDACDFG